MKIKYFHPLLGFAATVAGACLTYLAGLRLAIRDSEKGDGDA
jgi:hypothetical protein